MEQPPDVDLVEWLETAISVREFAAKTVVAESFTDGVWTYDYQGRPVPRIKGASWESTISGGTWNCTDDMDSCDETRAVGTAEGIHIALNDPAAGLRRCQADRKILGHCTRWLADETPAGMLARFTVQLLAEGYGYQEGR